MKRLIKYIITILILLLVYNNTNAQWDKIYNYYFPSQPGTVGKPIYFSFCTPDTGYFVFDSSVVGSMGTIPFSSFYMTIDGGITFKKLNFPVTDWNLNEIEQVNFYNKDSAIVLIDNIKGDLIYNSYDAGNTWSISKLKRNFNYKISTMNLINSKVGYFIECDYNDTNKMLKIVNDTLISFYNFHFIIDNIMDFRIYSDTLAYLDILNANSAAYLLKINIKNKYYQIISNNSNVSTTSIFFKNPATIYRYIRFNNDSCAYIKSVDYGKTWSKINFPYNCTSNISNIFFINNDTGFILQYYLYRTEDSGIIWKYMKPEIGIYYIQFLNDTLGYMFGYQLLGDTAYNWILMKTSNGGLLGIKNIINSENKFRIFPNPFNNNINIETDFNKNYYDIQIINSLGQNIENFNNIWSKNYFIDTKNLNTGFYILKIHSKNENTYYKILKN